MTGRELSHAGVPAVVARAGCLLGGTVAAAELVWLLGRSSVRDVVTTLRGGEAGMLATVAFEDVLVAVCTAALLLSAAWLVLVTGLVALEALAGPAGPARLLCPLPLRRLLLAGCGAAIVAGLATAPATADPPGSSGPVDAVPAVRLGGLDLPDRPVGGALHAVAPGESLWSIARDRLGEHANDAEVDAGWRAIHLANQHRVGSDPDLIFPGTILHIPELDPPDRKESS